jgi:uncharacterized protein (TIGR02646 family)
MIRKGAEPPTLTRHRATSDTDWDGYGDKDALRTYLVNEQRGLCCYCLSRIRAQPGKMKIEHWHCQANYAAERLVYGNLLGACMGNEGQPGKDQHCDSRKGDRDLSRNPADPSHRVEDMIRFMGDGTIVSQDRDFNTEINEVLNLNLAFLKNNRKAALRAFQDARSRNGPWPRAALEKWLREFSGESGTGDLEPFCQVVVYWLRKRLARP